VKILQANFHRGWGGQPSRILMLSQGLAARGHEVTLAVPPGSVLGARAREAGLRTFEEARFLKPRRVFSALADVGRLARHLREETYDLVDAHGSQDLWTTVFARRRAAPALPLVFTRHNTKRVGHHVLNRWLYRQVDQMIVVSASVIDRYRPLIEAGVLRRDRIAVVHSAYRPDRFHPGVDGSAFRAELGVGPDTPLIGVIGRLVPDKGQDDLLRAAPAILARHPDTLFAFAGTGTAAEDLRHLATQLGVVPSIRFLGFREDVPRITAALSVAVLPSVDCDASSAVLKEALACAVPAVATDIGGAGEILRDGETGSVVPPRDPARLSAAILALLDDPDRARAMGRLGSTDVAARFTPDRLTAESIAVYEAVLTQSGRRAAS
jgi:glycosyltransferase involved in cell wall biosynthesis